MLKVVNAISAQQIPTASTSSNEQRHTTTDAHTATHPLTVDIAQPNSAGISYNSYQEFQVTSSGIVLQNGPAARMILNKTIRDKPSKLNGIVKIAGQPAQLAFSNTNGMHLWGCNFLNTRRIIFAAGEPMVGSDGSLDAFLVSKKGQITINSVAKLKQFDQIDLIAYSIKIDGELQANTINISTGEHQINYTKLGVPVITSQPAASIQSRQNLSKLNQVSAGWLKFTKNAKVHAREHLRIKAALLYNSSHQIQSGGDFTLEVDRLDNTGTLRAQRDISLEAKTLTNQANALIDGRILTLNTQEQLKNQGVIQGSTVAINAQSLINDGVEDTEEHQAGVIMARRQLTIGAQTLHNQEHGLMHSDGELTIGGSLNTQRKVDSSAQKLTNTTSSTIESRKNLSIQADHLDNQNGQMTTSSDFILRSQTFNNTRGHIEVSGGQSIFDIQANTINNNSGQLLHTGAGQTQIVAHQFIVNRNSRGIKGAGLISGKGPVILSAPEVSNHEGATILSNQTLKIKAATSFKNETGTLSASQKIEIDTDFLDNCKGLIIVGTEATSEKEASNSTSSPSLHPESVLEVHAREIINEDGGQLIQSGTGKIKIFSDEIGSAKYGVKGGLISAQGQITIETKYIWNEQEGQISGKNVNLKVENDLYNYNGTLFASDMLSLKADDLMNLGQGVLQSDGNLDISVDIFRNEGTVYGKDQVLIEGESLSNQDKFEYSDFLSEPSQLVQTQNPALIAGNTISIGAHDRSDAFLMNSGGTIFAQNHLEIGTKKIENLKHAVFYSGGTLIIGGELDAQFKVQGTSKRVLNEGSTIEALGNLSIYSEEVFNKNAKFTTQEQVVEQRQIDEYQPENQNQRYDGGNVEWIDADGPRLIVRNGGPKFADFTHYNCARTVTRTVVTHSEPGKIQAGGLIQFSLRRVINDNSQITAGDDLNFEGGSIEFNNVGAMGRQVTTDEGTSQYSRLDWRGGFCRDWKRSWGGVCLTA